MSQFILVLALLAGTTAQADIQPEDIFGGILDIIQDQINKDNNPSYVPGVILKDLGNGRIALGRIKLNDDSTLDAINLPKCNLSKNQPVTHLRFQVGGADAYVKRVKITFQNNTTETVEVDEVFEGKTASDWYKVKGDARCVKSIAVRGQAVNNQFGFDSEFDLDSFNYKPGHSGAHPGGPYPGPGGIFGPGKPVIIKPPQSTVLTFIGLIEESNGF
ncbi:MAG: DUF2541 family protein [Bdellovibrionaceae bacterium]|nr:DUF2541 family protein [Pseudobdellovibrionaceae bacterium]